MKEVSRGASVLLSADDGGDGEEVSLASSWTGFLQQLLAPGCQQATILHLRAVEVGEREGGESKARAKAPCKRPGGCRHLVSAIVPAFPVFA